MALKCKPRACIVNTAYSASLELALAQPPVWQVSDLHRFLAARIVEVSGGTYYHQGQRFFDSIDWDALCRYASELHDGEICTLDPQITMGCNHMIRIVNFVDGSQWIARLRMLFTKTGLEAESQCHFFLKRG